MNFKKMLSVVLIIILSASLLPFSAFAAEEVFDVSISEDGNVSISYSYPYYRNADTSFVISENSTDEIIYFQQYRLNNFGALHIDGIYLPKGGEYTISLYPENRGSVLSAVETHFSEQDRLNLWNIASSSTNAEEIEDNWFYIESVLEFDIENLEYVVSDSDFFDKVASQRSGDHSVKNEENHNALTEYFELMALFTAYEQNGDTDMLRLLFSITDFTISSDAHNAFEGWTAVASDGDEALLFDIFSKTEKSVTSVDSLISYMMSSLSEYEVRFLLNMLNNAEHISQVSDVILSDGNSAILGISELVDSYRSLADTSSVDMAVMAKGFTSKNAFYAKFIEALTLALGNQGNIGQTPSAPPSVPSNPGSNYMGSSSGGANVSAGTSQSGAVSTFLDLSDFSWASDHINKLRSLGIISGKSASVFAPADNVTREEIAKLIVCLFKLEGTDCDAVFTDVAPASWYEDYVYCIAANGIASGIGGNMFGTGLNATRQDICVMLANALEKCGFDLLSSAPLTFADEAAISSYARASVEALCTEGIITGDTLNRFNPQSYATRAETAVMLSRIYTKYMKEGR